jgi:hypothetical protein
MRELGWTPLLLFLHKQTFIMNLYIPALLLLTFFTACDKGNSSVNNQYSIIQRHILPKTLQETSGIIKYRGLIWTFNDSGGKPEIYGFNTSGDSIEQTISLHNGINNDWEDITQDSDYIYIGDFGNNQGMRDSLVIYKIAKSSIPVKGDISVDAEMIVFTYPGYHPVKIPVSWSAFDCEAMVVKEDSLFLFTKDWTNGNSAIFSLPKLNGKYKARLVETLHPQGLITGADYKDKELLLIGYANFEPFIIRFTISDFNKITDAQGKRYVLTDLSTYQTEGICFDDAGILISSEKTRSPAQIIELKLH